MPSTKPMVRSDSRRLASPWHRCWQGRVAFFLDLLLAAEHVAPVCERQPFVAALLFPAAWLRHRWPSPFHRQNLWQSPRFHLLVSPARVMNVVTAVITAKGACSA